MKTHIPRKSKSGLEKPLVTSKVTKTTGLLLVTTVSRFVFEQSGTAIHPLLKIPENRAVCCGACQQPLPAGTQPEFSLTLALALSRWERGLSGWERGLSDWERSTQS
jgi:hypothetical protein